MKYKTLIAASILVGSVSCGSFSEALAVSHLPNGMKCCAAWTAQSELISALVDGKSLNIQPDKKINFFIPADQDCAKNFRSRYASGYQQVGSSNSYKRDNYGHNPVAWPSKECDPNATQLIPYTETLHTEVG